MQVRRTGIVSFYNVDRGFGVIAIKDEQSIIFWENGIAGSVKVNDVVVFYKSTTSDGSTIAVGVNSLARFREERINEIING